MCIKYWPEHAAFWRSTGNDLSGHYKPFWRPLGAILDFADGAALQAVSERPLRR